MSGFSVGIIDAEWGTLAVHQESEMVVAVRCAENGVTAKGHPDVMSRLVRDSSSPAEFAAITEERGLLAPDTDV